MNKLISTQNRVFISLVGPTGTKKSQINCNWLRIGTFQPKSEKIYSFYPCQYFQPFYDVMKEAIENLDVVEGVNFEFIDLLKTNGTKYLLTFDDSCEQICNSKAFDDIATNERHRGLSIIYIKYNLFHQSKLGQDFELQNTLNDLSKSHVMWCKSKCLGQNWGAQIRASWLVSRRNVCSLRSFVNWLVTTNRRSITLLYLQRIHFLKNSYRGLAETVKNFEQWTYKFSLLSKCSNYFHTNEKVFSFSFSPKGFIRFICDCIVNLLEGNMQSLKRHHMTKFQNEVYFFSPNTIIWKQKLLVLASEKSYNS